MFAAVNGAVSSSRLGARFSLPRASITPFLKPKQTQQHKPNSNNPAHRHNAVLRITQVSDSLPSLQSLFNIELYTAVQLSLVLNPRSAPRIVNRVSTRNTLRNAVLLLSLILLSGFMISRSRSVSVSPDRLDCHWWLSSSHSCNLAILLLEIGGR